MFQRNILNQLTTALADTRVVQLNGARQVGKSTLAQQLARQRGGQYLTLDDPVVAELARTDPSALVNGAAAFTVIDEVQSAPALFPVLKREVDRHPVPGRFLLTGSANVFMLPSVAESLAGRMQVLTLEPLSQSEIEGSPHNFIDALFGSAPWARHGVPTDRADLVRRILAGGFPEALSRTEPQRRDAWFGAYLASLLQRDVRDYANIDGLYDMPRLLSLLAARASALLNMAEVSRAMGIAHSTLRRYLSLLEALFIVQPLPAWSANLGKRLVKAPKVPPHRRRAHRASARPRGRRRAGLVTASWPVAGDLRRAGVAASPALGGHGSHRMALSHGGGAGGRPGARNARSAHRGR